MPLTTTVTPARRVHGTLRVPGDKSISHRYALLAALAEGPSHFTNFAPGADCRSTLTCLQELGVSVRETGDGIGIVGPGLGQLQAPRRPLDAGNSGSTIRMLTGILAAQTFTSQIGGDASLSKRPMRRVIDPLTRMGARIESANGCPPLTIHGARLSGLLFEPDVPSAQVKSAVLLAGLHAEGTTSVAETVRTRNHTELALEAFGGAPRVHGLMVSVDGGARLTGQTLSIPGDFSSAAYWLVAAAALPGSRIEVEDVGLNPTRIQLLDVLRRFGARVQVHATATIAGEPRGTIIVEGDRTNAITIRGDEVPMLIDELPAIAALASHRGTVTVREANELRVKESDRISVLVNGFRNLGIHAHEHPDGFSVDGGGIPPGGVADAHGDHRMAMAFAIAALGASGPSKIEGADSVVISYPDFFKTLDRILA